MRAAPLICLSLMACAGAPIDRSEHVGREVRRVPLEEVPVYGSLCEIETLEHDVIKGELLGVDDEHLHVMEGSQTRAIPRSSVRRMELVDLYTSGALGLGIWTGAGSTSTLSHGWLAIVSLPLWLGLGITSTVVAAFGNDAKLQPTERDKAKQFARYPQGMPGTVPSRRALEPLRPVRTSTAIEPPIPPLFLPGEEPNNPSGPPGGPR